MDTSFTQWRDSPNQRRNITISESFVISDSDEDVVETSSKRNLADVFINESNDDDDYDEEETSKERTPIKIYESSDDDDDTPVARVSEGTIRRKLRKHRITDSDNSERYDDKTDDDFHTINDSPTNFNNSDNFNQSSDDEDYSPEKSYHSSLSYTPIKNKGRKRKDVSHDTTREDIKELKADSSNDYEFLINIDKQNTNIDKNTDAIDEASYDVPVTIALDSDSSSERSSACDLATSYAKKEAHVTNLDPFIAQERALTLCKLQQLTNEVANSKLLLAEANVEILPDKGKKLRESIRVQEKEIEELKNKLENISLGYNFNNKQSELDEARLIGNEPFIVRDESNSDDTDYSDYHLNVDDIPMKPTTSPELRELGKKAQETRDKELTLTVERLQDLHGSLVARPSENEKAEDPRGLKVKLFPHQQHALAWLLWREQQKPSGGVLADDMGLGKTLSIISLIMTTLAKKDLNEADSDDEWNNDQNTLRYKGGTLIVCPASLLGQWQNEVQNKCKRGLLSVEVYHGHRRENIPKLLAKKDIVITTYHLLPRDYASNSTLYKINWKRVVLDEAHIIRNHKSKLSIAACELLASKRWALTGTPIQNKELDLYAILKFLKCSPFDDLRVWKRWVDNKNVAGHQRLATVMKTLMLRRTKEELMANGNLENLPDKCMEEVTVKLDPEEQLVYKKILVYSRTLFAQFLAQRAEKDHMVDLYSGKYDKPAFLSNPNKATKFTEAQNKLLARHADVKTHEILMLLLRLRQVCCHPALIHAMLDQEEMQQSGLMDMENVDPELLSRVHRMSLDALAIPDEKDVGFDPRIAGNLLTAENPVFNDDRISSKMRALLDKVKQLLETKDDKLIIVSQWTSLLKIIGAHLLKIKGVTFEIFAGDVAIKNRQPIVDSFNDPDSRTRILLLSLTAGGVGLNLIGGNHLLLFDIHWNPQLESQAQDRIYRFGQRKNVHVYKFICHDTIEERIKALQEQKLAIAQNVLSGERKMAMKLTLNDLKSLFNL